jgi:hypothetical protein
VETFKKRISGYFNTCPSISRRFNGLFPFLNIFRYLFWNWLASKDPFLSKFYTSNNLTLNKIEKKFFHNGFLIIEDFLNLNDHNNFLKNISLTNPNLDYKKPHQIITINLHDKYFVNLFKKKTNILLKKIGAAPIKINNLSLELNVVNGSDVSDPNTKLHIDRFIPTIKIFYFPDNVKDSPFALIPNTSMIDILRHKETLKALTKKDNTPFQLSKLYMNNFPKEKKFFVRANSLIIAATHCIHRRVNFKSKTGTRRSIRIVPYGEISGRGKLLKNLNFLDAS